MKVTKILGLAAIGAMLVLAAPSQQAQAMSLINPGTAATVQDQSNLATDVSWHYHRHHHYRHHHWHHRWHRHHWHHRHWRHHRYHRHHR